MEITRNVILDLLPMYLANEVSEDTRALVEKYLESDPELARVAEKTAALELQEDPPFPLTEEDKVKAYRKTRWMMFLYIVIIAVVIVAVLGITIMVFLTSFLTSA
jgi:hypothetical protein